MDLSHDIDEGRQNETSKNTALRIMLIKDMSCTEKMGAKMRGDVRALRSWSEFSLSLVLSNTIYPAAREAEFERKLLEKFRDACIAKSEEVGCIHVDTPSAYCIDLVVKAWRLYCRPELLLQTETRMRKTSLINRINTVNTEIPPVAPVHVLQPSSSQAP